jgi:hypothetical protein
VTFDGGAAPGSIGGKSITSYNSSQLFGIITV